MNSKVIIFATLATLFLLFSVTIYFNRPDTTIQNKKSGKGKLVWQKYNCQSCHQMYGLGGYLGPDLTNVISERGKGPAYVLAMIRSGVKQMPSFSLSEEEEEQLIEFLRQADRSGSADPRNFEVTTSGMIHAR